MWWGLPTRADYPLYATFAATSAHLNEVDASAEYKHCSRSFIMMQWIL